MTELWCIEYTHLTIKAEAIQKECNKINDTIQSSLRIKVPSQNNKIKCLTQHSYSESRDWKDRDALYQKILRLRRHCRTAKCALIDMTKEKRKTKVEQAKSICKKAVKSYEDEYERVRELCNGEIERLEKKRKEIGQSLEVHIEGTEY